MAITERPEKVALEVTDDTDEAMMTMLHDHVPLSLLMDLTSPTGPESAEILAEEGLPETAWWEQ